MGDGTTKRFSLRTGPVAATLCLLGGLAADRALFHTAPAEVEPYHAAVAAAGRDLPYRVGTWVGRDGPEPPGAESLLRPNVLIARDYRDAVTGRAARLLLVQCRDARDLIGHYPPVCYAGQGWAAVSAEPRDWRVGDVRVSGTRYQFAQDRDGGRQARLAIDNFMVLPDGTTCRDMAGVHEAASAPSRKFLGAAQVQIITDPSLSDAERDEVLDVFVTASRDVIAQIWSVGSDER